MSSAIASSPLSDIHDISRLSANFHPSIWGDYFIQYDSESTQQVIDEMKERINVLKEQVRTMLVPASDKASSPATIITLIDSIQRLCLSYHFESEIDQLLEYIHNTYVQNGIITLFHQHLHSLALVFRLLRQEGYRVSPDVFIKFKDEQGNFYEGLTKDVEGMLSLYEAAHVRVHGEAILDEALAFTSTHLEKIATKLSSPLAAQVKHSLRQSFHQGIPRLEVKGYISIYQQDPAHNQILLTLAKLDFNMLQKLHQKELAIICKWWKELDVPTKYPFARDRIVEGYFWILAVYFEPQYFQARKILLKAFAMTSIIDDMYDAYATVDELELFTEALERWNINCLDSLPEYMKLVYSLVLEVYGEIEQEMRKEGREYSATYGIDELKRLVRMYMIEARWLNNKYTPTVEEYLHISLVSCGYPCLTTTSFIGMGDLATEDVFKWAVNDPKIIKANSVVCRLMDDIVSNEFEQEREHVSSFVECYMKQYNVSREYVIHECRKRVMDAWKDINEECLRPTKIPLNLLKRPVNLARFMDVFYKDKDNYTHSKGIMKTCIETLLLHSLPI